MRAGWIPVPHLGVELPQAEPTAGQRRTHAERLSDGHRLAVEALCALDIGGFATDGDLAEQVESPRLLALLLVPAREIERLLGQLPGALVLTGDEVPLGE